MTKKFLDHVRHSVLLVFLTTLPIVSWATKDTKIALTEVFGCQSSPEKAQTLLRQVGPSQFLNIKKQYSLSQALRPQALTINTSCPSNVHAIRLDLAHRPLQPLPHQELRPSGSASKNQFLVDRDFQTLLDKVTQSDLTINRMLHLYQNGESKDAILSLITNSKKFIFIDLLALSCDEATEPLLSALEQKAAEGLTVGLNVNKLYAIANTSCLRRLERHGIIVTKSPTHSSFYTNDQRELLIGSQSLAKMFLLSNGFNGLDRDVMLYINGPVATDAWRYFLSLWKATPAIESRHKLQHVLLKTLQAEVENSERGPTMISSHSAKKGIACRFLSQSPSQQARGLQEGLWQMSVAAKAQISFSGVKFGYSEKSTLPKNASAFLDLLAEKSRTGLSINFIGNGLGGGNGELTMILNDLTDLLGQKKWSSVASLLGRINRWDSQRTTKKHFLAYQKFLANSRATVWTYFNFLHYKVWSFDGSALFVGSSNLHDESFDQFDETGVLCFDKKLVSNWEAAQELDLLNSTAYGATHFSERGPVSLNE